VDDLRVHQCLLDVRFDVARYGAPLHQGVAVRPSLIETPKRYCRSHVRAMGKRVGAHQETPRWLTSVSRNEIGAGRPWGKGAAVEVLTVWATFCSLVILAPARAGNGISTNLPTLDCSGFTVCDPLQLLAAGDGLTSPSAGRCRERTGGAPWPAAPPDGFHFFPQTFGWRNNRSEDGGIVTGVAVFGPGPLSNVCLS